jgi:hypothetical protein
MDFLRRRLCFQQQETESQREILSRSEAARF